MTAPGDRLMSRFDVVVLGAGPAGCATAIYCAQRGLRVALLETSPFPRHRPGETLHPGVEPLLHTLGVAPLDCLRHAGHWVHWDKPPRFQAFNDGEWQGFQISRSLLDGQLLSAADAAGVHILHPRRIDRVLVRQNRVQGVSADSTECKGHYVVDATGRHGWLQRQLHIPWLRFSPRLIARYGYCHDNRLHDDELGLFAHARGWHWLARISRSCLHWTQLHFVDDTRCRERPRVLDQCAAVGPVRGADVSWRRCLRTAGPGYFFGWGRRSHPGPLRLPRRDQGIDFGYARRLGHCRLPVLAGGRGDSASGVSTLATRGVRARCGRVAQLLSNPSPPAGLAVGVRDKFDTHKNADHH